MAAPLILVDKERQLSFSGDWGDREPLEWTVGGIIAIRPDINEIPLPGNRTFVLNRGGVVSHDDGETLWLYGRVVENEER